MKELSIEEKARRYDEAIKIAKSNYETIVQMDEDCTFAKEGIVNTFHRMFPELKESEDERIRKWLIGYFNQYIIDGMPQVFGNGLNVKDVIAWLEKQGEQKSIEWSGKIGVKHAEGKLKEMLDKKENPAWSEDVQQWIDAIIKDYEEWYDVNKDHRATIQVKINILKSLKDRYTWKPSDEQMEALDVFIYAKYPNIEKYGAAVKSLYQDLKKLIGE